MNAPSSPPPLAFGRLFRTEINAAHALAREFDHLPYVVIADTVAAARSVGEPFLPDLGRYRQAIENEARRRLTAEPADGYRRLLIPRPAPSLEPPREITLD